MSAIIFDFDGTIADSFELTIQIFYDITKRTKKVDDAEIFRLRQLTLKHVIKELHISPFKVPFLLYKGRRLMTDRIAQVKPFPELPKVIQQLHADGHELFIMSSNSTTNIQTFLKQHKLTKYFKDVHGGVGLLNKASGLRKVIKHFNLDREDLFYVGDEARDVEGCAQADVKCVAVSWGYNSANLLRKTNPFAIVTDPQELYLALEEYGKTTDTTD